MLFATHAMGTRFELVVPGEESAALRAIGEEALREIQHWHGRLSRFLPESDVSRLNCDSGASVGGDVKGLLELCERVREESGGAFDPRTGPGGTLDLGAVAKGFALDRAAAILLEYGVRCAFLHGGTSSVVAIGVPPDGDGWWLALRSDGAPLRLRLRDQAMGVSAPRGRMREDGITHIIDPRTGLPSSHTDTAAVVAPLTVLTAAALCDAWSTALIVLGHRPPALPEPFESHIHTPGRGWQSAATALSHA